MPAGSHFSQVTGDHFTQTEYRDWVRQASVKEFITGSDTGLSPAKRQAIIWTSTRQQIKRRLWLTYRKFNTRKAFRNVWCDIFTVYLSCYHISFTPSFFFQWLQNAVRRRLQSGAGLILFDTATASRHVPVYLGAAAAHPLSTALAVLQHSHPPVPSPRSPATLPAPLPGSPDTPPALPPGCDYVLNSQLALSVHPS